MISGPAALTAHAALTPAPAALAGTFLIDAHVHCHRGIEPAEALGHAARNLAAAARAGGLTPAAGWLLFTETADAHVFTALRRNPRELVGWTLEATEEEVSLLARGSFDFPLVLVAGRQIVTAEGLEVLALAAAGPFADGQELAATVAAVGEAGGLAVLPWGFGKWWGRRGKVLTRFLEQAQPGTVFLGDNGGRPQLGPIPRPFTRAAGRGIFTLPGSDPLPLPAERDAVGRYGFVLEGAVDPARPAAGLLWLLRGLRHQPAAFGRRQRLAPFLVRQIALRRVPAHDVLTPDLETASESYAGRFAGPVGAWLLRVQQNLVLRLLAGRRDEPLAVLEVGGGHGQITSALLADGHRVVVHGSRLACAHRLRPLLERQDQPLAFVVADLWQLPFPDRAFDAVIGLRLLAHVERHEDLLAEMARVSRRQVVVDFPPLLSANLLNPLLFWTKRRIEGNTRPFFCYRPRQLQQPLCAAGFGQFRIEKELFLPMVVHRQMRRPRLSARVEDVARRLGLTRLLGAPVLLAATRGPATPGSG
jgi:SAM-dependent methyltransferase